MARKSAESIARGRASANKWNKDHKDLVNKRRREASALWRAANPELCKQMNAARYAANSEQKKAGMKAWYKLNKESVKKRDKYKNLAKYGITVEQYQAMFDAQEGRCKICKGLPGKVSLAVDHCHATGKVRALLCGFCNTRLAVLESPDWMALAVKYLEHHK